MTERALAPGRLPAAVAAAVAAGVDVVQVRERALGGAALLEHVRTIAAAARRGAAARGGAVRIVVNRRIDVALAAGADGVHLGYDALGPAQARALLGPSAWIGVSAHAPAEVFAAAREGADYAHLAPIGAPLSKPASQPPLGTGALTAAAGAGISLIAQGGVVAEGVAELIAAGADGVAVTGAILAAPDPGAAARALRSALDRAREASCP